MSISSQTAPEKENQRVWITKKLLKDALIDLLQTTPMQKVTISAICGKAGINRTTFYKHYTDEISLYYDIQNEVLEMLRNVLSVHGLDCLEILFNFIKDNGKISNVIFNAGIDNTLPQKIFSLPEISELIRQEYKGPADPHFQQMFYFICHGGYALIKDWVNNGFNATATEMADTIKHIVSKLLC
ncbi:MAG: TetR/AcrR family transcriptional regulator [Clostridia bacterium]|nr:TetR/AcrR family transcriptional regulator [Clostridia bacterium]